MKLKHLDTKPINNSGGSAAFVYFATVASILSGGIPVDTTGTPTHTVTDIAARNSLTTPASGATCLVESEGLWYEFVGSAWERASPVINNHPFVFDSGVGFFKIGTSADKAGFEFEVPTEDDVTGKYLKPIFAVPGHGVNQLEFEKLVTTSPGVMILISNDGEKFQYGSVDNPVTVKVKELNEGQKAMDWKGIVYEVSAAQSSKVHYMADISEND